MKRAKELLKPWDGSWNAEKFAQMEANARAFGIGREQQTYNCPRCLDTGLMEYISGDYDVGNEWRHVWITASEAQPVYRRCTCRPRNTAKPSGPVTVEL